MNEPTQKAQLDSAIAEKLLWTDPEFAQAAISDCTEGGLAAAIGIENDTYQIS